MLDIKILTASAAIAVTGFAANAGGLAPEVMEPSVVVADTPMAPAGSISSGYVVLGLLAALVAASASDSDDEGVTVVGSTLDNGKIVNLLSDGSTSAIAE